MSIIGMVIDIFLLQKYYKIIPDVLFISNLINKLVERHNNLPCFPF